MLWLPLHVSTPGSILIYDFQQVTQTESWTKYKEKKKHKKKEKRKKEKKKKGKKEYISWSYLLKITWPTPATRNSPDFAKAKEFANPTCIAQMYQHDQWILQ